MTEIKSTKRVLAQVFWQTESQVEILCNRHIGEDTWETNLYKVRKTGLGRRAS